MPDDAAVPPEWPSGSWAKVAEQKHASMANGVGLREELRVTLRDAGRLLAEPVHISARMPSAVQEGESFEISIRPVVDGSGRTPPLNLAVHVEAIETANPSATTSVGVDRMGTTYSAVVPGLGRGLYRVVIDKRTKAAVDVDPLSDSLVVYQAPDGR